MEVEPHAGRMTAERVEHGPEVGEERIVEPRNAKDMAELLDRKDAGILKRLEAAQKRVHFGQERACAKRGTHAVVAPHEELVAEGLSQGCELTARLRERKLQPRRGFAQGFGLVDGSKELEFIGIDDHGSDLRSCGLVSAGKGAAKTGQPPGVVFEYARREAFRARRRSSTSRLRPVFSRVRRREGRPPFVGLEEKDAYVRSPLASGRIRETHLVEVFCSRTGSRRVERHESGARTCVVRRGTASEASDDRRTQTGRMRRTNIWNENPPMRPAADLGRPKSRHRRHVRTNLTKT